MGNTTRIAWCDATFNPWWGCVKVSPACTNCYAASFDHRLGGDHWGPNSDRKFFGDKHWNEPVRWNRAAEKAGVRARVFCASMADVFEDRRDLDEPRERLWKLIAATPQLDWLLLTKRPENIDRLMRPYRDSIYGGSVWPNVWLGTTVENQAYADERIHHLLQVPAAVRFLSAEPLLGPIRLGDNDNSWLSCTSKAEGPSEGGCCESFDVNGVHFHGIDWVITGCESGPGARRQSIDDFRSLRDQCAEAKVAFFFKQATEHGSSIRLGKDSWSKSGGVIELPLLDGIQHAAFPEVAR